MDMKEYSHIHLTTFDRGPRPSNAGPHKKTTSGLPILLILVMVIALLAPAGCSGRDPATPVDAAEVLRSAIEPMKIASSFHFSYAVTKPQGSKPPQGTEIVSIVGDVSLEGSMKATVDLNQSGVPLQFQFVATEDIHYVQNPTSQKWQSVPADLSPIGRINLSSGAVQILEQVRHAKYISTKKIGGVMCYEVEGSVAATDIADIVASANATTDLHCVIWIGVDDRLLHRIQLTGAAEVDEDPRVLRTIELSRFDEPLVIEVPQ
ncbi:MAG: LppX_LprAFG lipoprotein [Actinobacteria bacterium]|nr:LppX_LprAFG lipoprotein [Actinomycetota bacterium]